MLLVLYLVLYFVCNGGTAQWAEFSTRQKLSNLLSTTIHKGYSSSLGSGYSTLSTVASHPPMLCIVRKIWIMYDERREKRMM